MYQQLKFLQNAIGAVPGPQDVWLTMRGIKTLPLRMERHSENALEVAKFLSDHPAFGEVFYPGLETHPQYELGQRQMPRGGGGMVSAILNAGPATAQRFVSRTKIFALAESLGGVESLVEHPFTMTHASTANSPLACHPGLVRLSVGVEHIDDLIEDLQQALYGL
jgi:cystathionine beta-lyase/cystathionine gamma-synthase